MSGIRNESEPPHNFSRVARAPYWPKTDSSLLNPCRTQTYKDIFIRHAALKTHSKNATVTAQVLWVVCFFFLMSLNIFLFPPHTSYSYLIEYFLYLKTLREASSDFPWAAAQHYGEGKPLRFLNSGAQRKRILVPALTSLFFTSGGLC